MRRYTNLALATLLTVAFATGLTAQAMGTPWGRVPVVLHGIAALGLVLLAPWKSLIVRRGLRRSAPGQVWSIGLAIVILLTVASGLLQMSGTVNRLGPLTTMQVHVGSAVLAVGSAIAHYRRHPVRPHRSDLGRRNFIRSAALGVGAGAVWLGWEAVARAAGWPGGERRFTGSHERGSGDPTAMPVTQWLFDSVPRADRETWMIAVGDAPLGPADVAALPLETITATLDCTSGWYAEQEWSGVRLSRIIDIGEAASIEVRSVTGYSRRFPATDADRLWLAFEVGGAPLSAGHGYPARLVAPDRRGFWWVKWVEAVDLSNVPWWLQLPFPLS